MIGRILVFVLLSGCVAAPNGTGQPPAPLVFRNLDAEMFMNRTRYDTAPTVTTCTPAGTSIRCTTY